MASEAPIYIRLMREFSDSPLWGMSWEADLVGMVMPEDLGIVDPLASDLVAWNDQYTSGASTDTYEWPTPEQAAAHDAAGLVLVERLREYLGDGYVVLWTGDPDPPLPPPNDDPNGPQIGLFGAPRRRRLFRRRRDWGRGNVKKLPITHVVVSPDFGAFPLWNRSPQGFPGMIDAETLALSPELVTRLVAWNEFYETHNLPGTDDYATDDAATDEDWAEWEAQGRSISADLQSELGSTVKVYFYLDDQRDIPEYDSRWMTGFSSGSFTLDPPP